MAPKRAVDKVVAAIPWKKRRTILVFLREFSGRSFLLLRDFQRHKVLERWYPGRRFFTLPIERADAVGRALIAAANGEVPSGEPEWWGEFREQYEAMERSDSVGQQTLATK